MIQALLDQLNIEECRQLLEEVIIDQEIAYRLAVELCQDLRNEALTASQLMYYPRFLRHLIRFSPHIVIVCMRKVNLIRSVAFCCQRQICSGELDTVLNHSEVHMIQDSLIAIL